MTATLAEHSALPFHLTITEPIDESAMTVYPDVEGAYDAVEQIWKLPAGTLPPTPFTFTHCLIQGHAILDDGMVD